MIGVFTERCLNCNKNATFFPATLSSCSDSHHMPCRARHVMSWHVQQRVLRSGHPRHSRRSSLSEISLPLIMTTITTTDNRRPEVVRRHPLVKSSTCSLPRDHAAVSLLVGTVAVLTTPPMLNTSSRNLGQLPDSLSEETSRSINLKSF